MSNGKTLIVCCLLAVVVAIAIHSASGIAVNSPQGRVGLGGVCNATHICNQTGTNCTNGRCVCTTDHVLTQQTCLKVANRIYDACNISLQCTTKIVNSQCVNGGCVCKEGYFGNAQLNRCDLATCTPNCNHWGYATCSDGVCKCNPGGLQYATYCYRHISTIGATCDASVNSLDRCYLVADGMDQQVTCDKGKCACKSPSKPNKAKTSCKGSAPTTTASIMFVFIAIVASLQAW